MNFKTSFSSKFYYFRQLNFIWSHQNRTFVLQWVCNTEGCLKPAECNRWRFWPYWKLLRVSVPPEHGAGGRGMQLVQPSPGHSLDECRGECAAEHLWGSRLRSEARDARVQRQRFGILSDLPGSLSDRERKRERRRGRKIDFPNDWIKILAEWAFRLPKCREDVGQDQNSQGKLENLTSLLDEYCHIF